MSRAGKQHSRVQPREDPKFEKIIITIIFLQDLTAIGLTILAKQLEGTSGGGGGGGGEGEIEKWRMRARAGGGDQFCLVVSWPLSWMMYCFLPRSMRAKAHRMVNEAL